MNKSESSETNNNSQSSTTQVSDLLDSASESRVNNVVNKAGHAPLHEAVWFNKLEQVKILCADAKSDLNVRDNSGATPLHIAAKKGYEEIVEYLLSQPKTKKIDVNVHMSNYLYHKGFTPLTLATSCGMNKIVKLLGEHEDIKINEPTIDGLTALHYAVMHQNLEIIKYLCAHKDILMNAQTFHTGETALHLAAKEGYLAICKILIAYGININAVDKDNHTAHYLALHSELEYSDDDFMNEEFKQIHANRVFVAEYLEGFGYPKILKQVRENLSQDLQRFKTGSDDSKDRQASAQEIQQLINEGQEEKVPVVASEAANEVAKRAIIELVTKLVEHKNVQEKKYKKNNPFAYMGVKCDLVEMYKRALSILPVKLVAKAEEEYEKQQALSIASSSNKYKY